MRMVVKGIEFYGYDSVPSPVQAKTLKQQTFKSQMVLQGNQLRLKVEKWIQGVRHIEWLNLKGQPQ